VTTPAPRTAGLLGAGTIGLSWAALFASSGLEVRLQDPRSDLQETLEQAVRQIAPVLPGAPDAELLLSRIRLVDTLEDAVRDVDVVQENGPERLDLKREMFARVEAAAPRTALLLSSTSGLMPTDMSADMVDPGRLLVGHPFNPPHVVPLVEVVPGAQTPVEAVEAAVAFYRGLGRVPVVLRREVGGFVANRLQSAVFRESVHLVLSGVVTMEELDEVMRQSIGPRWATAGPSRACTWAGARAGCATCSSTSAPGWSAGGPTSDSPS
jgi:ketoreductase RED1